MVERHERDANAYRGEVVLYYPEQAPHTPENDLYLALAQVIEKSNLGAGIQQLTAAIERYSPKRAEFYLELAEAWRNNGQLAKALPIYKEAVPQSEICHSAAETWDRSETIRTLYGGCGVPETGCFRGAR